MNLETLKSFLLWCAVINYAVLIVWFLALVTARGTLYRLHGRIFGIEPEKVASMHFRAMAFYKIGVMIFNLVPWIVLRFLV